jgi:nucleoside-diphosphate-sugar epimerase
MRVFVTGASGFIGSAVVRELAGAGHQVVGLARSEAAATAVAEAGAEVLRGSLGDLDSLRRGAAASDGVIHTAFVHEFSNYAASAEMDRVAIETIGAELAGSQRPFVVTAGVALIRPGRVVTESDEIGGSITRLPRVSETTALSLVPRGVRASILRLPPSVHGDGDHGFVPALIGIARQKGASAYVSDGMNRWSAVHRLDAALLFRLTLEKASAGARVHGVADEGVPFKEIATLIGRHLSLPVVAKSPEEAADHFGWIAPFASLDIAASSALTQERLRWRPTRVGLLDDLERGRYFESGTAQHA